MVLDLRSDKRRNDDVLNKHQKSFHDELGIFNIRPRIVDMSHSGRNFQPAIRYVEQ